MRRGARATQRGFTLIEILLTIMVAGTGLVAALRLLGTSDDLSASSRLHLDASARYREAHRGISRELRNADITTLAGFDGAGVATQPRFRCVTGMESGVVAHGPECELRFEPSPRSVPGVGAVGSVVLASTGLPTRVVARQVVAGTFQVRQEGRNLVIRLRIYEGPNPQNMATLQGETVVSLRN